MSYASVYALKSPIINGIYRIIYYKVHLYDEKTTSKSESEKRKSYGLGGRAELPTQLSLSIISAPFETS